MEDLPGETAVTLPADAKPLSEVVRALEAGGYAPVVEVGFADDHWDVKAYRDGQLVQLRVGLTAGEVLPATPPAAKRPLSEIVKRLEEEGYGPILSIEWIVAESGGGGMWQLEAYKDSEVVSVNVDPVSGRVRAD